MKLTDNFTLHEMTKSHTAVRLGIDNTPSKDAIMNMILVCASILEPVRKGFGGVPIVPSSGYRSLALNRAKKSKDTSQHILGQAVDFEIHGVPNDELAIWIADNLIFDQLILEHHKKGEPNSGWVHVSYNRAKNRNQVLTYDGKRTLVGLIT